MVSDIGRVNSPDLKMLASPLGIEKRNSSIGNLMNDRKSPQYRSTVSYQAVYLDKIEVEKFIKLQFGLK